MASVLLGLVAKLTRVYPRPRTQRTSEPVAGIALVGTRLTPLRGGRKTRLARARGPTRADARACDNPQREAPPKETADEGCHVPRTAPAAHDRGRRRRQAHRPRGARPHRGLGRLPQRPAL